MGIDKSKEAREQSPERQDGGRSRSAHSSLREVLASSTGSRPPTLPASELVNDHDDDTSTVTPANVDRNRGAEEICDVSELALSCPATPRIGSFEDENFEQRFDERSNALVGTGAWVDDGIVDLDDLSLLDDDEVFLASQGLLSCSYTTTSPSRRNIEGDGASDSREEGRHASFQSRFSHQRMGHHVREESNASHETQGAGDDESFQRRQLRIHSEEPTGQVRSRSTSRSTAKRASVSHRRATGGNDTSDEHRRGYSRSERVYDNQPDEPLNEDGHAGPGYDYPCQFHEGARLRPNATPPRRATAQVNSSPLARRQQDPIYQKTVRWLQGYDPRDDVRFDTVEAGVSSVRARVSRRGANGEFLIPRRGSNPIQFDRSYGIARAAGLDRSQPVPAPVRRTQTQPQRPKPPLHKLGLDGVYDDDIYFSMNAFGHLPESEPNFYSSMAPRQTANPSNQAQQHQHQVNGSGPAGPGAGPSNGLPHAATNLDMQYLWSVIQELSNVLAQNRAQTASIIGNVQQIQARVRDEDTSSFGDVNGEQSGNRAAEFADLQARLHQVTRQRDELLAENDDLSKTIDDFEATMQSIMDRLRNYGMEHATAMNEIRRHYNSLLQQEREANLALRVEHGQWQAGLGRAVELARLALRERSKETEPLEMRLREAKAENRVLRRLIGWEVEEDSEDEEERRQEEDRKEAARLRSQAAFPGSLEGAGVGPQQG